MRAKLKLHRRRKNIELARQVDIVNFRPQLMEYYILSKNQIVHSIWTFICGYKGKKKIDERKYPWTVQNNPYYMVVYFLEKL